MTIERGETFDVAELRVPGRFRGPPGVANGGVASGSLAALLGGVAEVTLRRPVPLDRPLPVRGDGAGALMVEDGRMPPAEARSAKAPVAPAARATSTPRCSPAASCAARRARQATGCGSSPAGRCGRRRGHRRRPSRTRTAGTAAVLGRMAATLGGLPRPGDRCRVVAWPLAGDGRKLLAGSALLGPGGEVLAAARTVWITVARHTVVTGGARS